MGRRFYRWTFLRGSSASGRRSCLLPPRARRAQCRAGETPDSSGLSCTAQHRLRGISDRSFPRRRTSAADVRGSRPATWGRAGIAPVAVEKSELDFGVPRSVEQRLVDVPVIGIDRLFVPDPLGVLPDGGLAKEKAAQGLLALRGLLLPVSLERFPEVVVEAPSS